MESGRAEKFLSSSSVRWLRFAINKHLMSCRIITHGRRDETSRYFMRNGDTLNSFPLLVMVPVDEAYALIITCSELSRLVMSMKTQYVYWAIDRAACSFQSR